VNDFHFINSSKWYHVYKNPTIHILDMKYGHYESNTLRWHGWKFFGLFVLTTVHCDVTFKMAAPNIREIAISHAELSSVALLDEWMNVWADVKSGAIGSPKKSLTICRDDFFYFAEFDFVTFSALLRWRAEASLSIIQFYGCCIRNFEKLLIHYNTDTLSCH
jgi:hypothetical protein